MKKLFLIGSILLTSMYSFAATKENNLKITEHEDLKPNELCGVTITFYDSNGYITGWKFHSTQKESYIDCLVYQGSIIEYYKSRGYRVTYSTKQLQDYNIN